MTSSLALLSPLVFAQATDAPTAPPDASESIDVEVFHEPRFLWAPLGTFHRNGVADGHDGWVTISTMIDRQGKPYEAMIVDSSGNAAIEKAALKAMDRLEFAPAHRGATTIDSSLTFKLSFTHAPTNSASPKFIRNYEQFSKAVAAGDKATADRILPTLNGENFYEECFEHYGRYYYFVRWGTPADQLKELSLALAGEKRPGYLPREAFIDALLAKFSLQGKAGDYGGVLATWTVLEPLAPKARRPALIKAVEQIKALQQSNEPIRFDAVIGERGNYAADLLRNRFSVDVASGAVNEIKLRCKKQFLFFKYQPGIEYSIGKSEDQCGIEVVGMPGTKFVLTQ